MKLEGSEKIQIGRFLLVCDFTTPTESDEEVVEQVRDLEHDQERRTVLYDKA